MLERLRRAWRWRIARAMAWLLDRLEITSTSGLYLGEMGPQDNPTPRAPPHPYRAPVGACTCERATLEDRIDGLLSDLEAAQARADRADRQVAELQALFARTVNANGVPHRGWGAGTLRQRAEVMTSVGAAEVQVVTPERRASAERVRAHIGRRRI